MPPVWKGRIIIKNAAEATVQMHYMFGQKDYLNMAMATLDKLEKDPSLRIGQRMKAEGDGLYREFSSFSKPEYRNLFEYFVSAYCKRAPIELSPERVYRRFWAVFEIIFHLS